MGGKKTNEPWENNNEQQTGECDHLLNGKIPISRACILGVIVNVQLKRPRIITIDDGTALIDCLEWYEENEESESTVSYFRKLQVGTLVKALGNLQFPPDTVTLNGSESVRRYSKIRQLVLTAPVQVQTDINAQVMHWKSCMELWEGFYSKQEFFSNVAISERKKLEAEVEGGGKKIKPAALLTMEEKLCEVIYQAILKSPPMPYLHDRFKSAVEVDLKNHCFDVKTLRENDPLVRNFFLTQNLSKNDDDKLLKDALNILIKQGKIYEYSMTSEKESVYCVLTYAELIAPQLFKFICKEVNTSEDQSVNEKKILSYFQSESGDYRCVVFLFFYCFFLN